MTSNNNNKKDIDIFKYFKTKMKYIIKIGFMNKIFKQELKRNNNKKLKKMIIFL